MKKPRLIECKTCNEKITQTTTICPKCGCWQFSAVTVISCLISVILILYFISGGFSGPS